MPSEILGAVFAALVLALSAAACGPRPAANTGRTDCQKQCDLDVMTCLETRVCLDLGGQKVPCEEECRSELAACEQACDGR